MLIFTLSARSAFHPPFSASDPELSALSFGVLSLDKDCIRCSDERLVALPASSDRRGDASVSDDDRLVMVGGGGDPSDFFDKNPAWNLFAFGLISIEGTARYKGNVGRTMLCSIEDTSGVDPSF